MTAGEYSDKCHQWDRRDSINFCAKKSCEVCFFFNYLQFRAFVWNNKRTGAARSFLTRSSPARENSSVYCLQEPPCAPLKLHASYEAGDAGLLREHV